MPGALGLRGAARGEGRRVPDASPLPSPVLRTDYRLRSRDFGSPVLVAPSRERGPEDYGGDCSAGFGVGLGDPSVNAGAITRFAGKGSRRPWRRLRRTIMQDAAARICIGSSATLCRAAIVAAAFMPGLRRLCVFSGRDCGRHRAERWRGRICPRVFRPRLGGDRGDDVRSAEGVVGFANPGLAPWAIECRSVGAERGCRGGGRLQLCGA